MTPELKEKLHGRRVVASMSGGKDSGAMRLWLIEQEIEHEAVHLLTGWDHQATLDYLRGELTEKTGPVLELRGDLLFADLVRKKGMFPSRTRRFCTQKLKVEPMQRYITSRVEAGEDLVNAVGIRRAESQARSQMPEWEWSEGFDCEVWRPLVEWSEQDVIDIHKRHGLRPNPLYLTHNVARVGCWPCIFASKTEIRNIADTDPARIEEIAALEASVQAAAEARWAAKGSSLAEQGHMLPTFFQAMGKLRSEGEREGRMVPIADVVKWARTSQGGVQFDMFGATQRDAGCMRWGLCEVLPPDGEDDP